MLGYHSGIILPMLSHRIWFRILIFTPYSIWLATGSIRHFLSPLLPLLKNMYSHESGTLVFCTTVRLRSPVLARKSRKPHRTGKRLLCCCHAVGCQHDVSIYTILILIFSKIFPVIRICWLWRWWRLLLPGLSIPTKRPENQPAETEEDDSSNPLEFKVAFDFLPYSLWYSLFLTHYTLVYAGTGGLNLLSFVSGFSDITFILNLLQKYRQCGCTDNFCL